MGDFRLALRRLLKRPGATFASVVTLAFSIGAAAATWALLDAVLLRPLPVQDADRLFVVGRTTPSEAPSYGFSYHWYPHLRDGEAFERIASEWSGMSLLVSPAGGTAVQTPLSFVTHEYLEVLGINIPLGRGFAPDDDRRGAPVVALLTDRYWRRTFNASPSVLGQTLSINGTQATIVGVTSRGYRGLSLTSAPDVILPFHVIADVGPKEINYLAEPVGPGKALASPTAGLKIVGRLAPGASPQQAAERLGTLGFPPAILAGRPLPPGVAGPTYLLIGVNTAAVPEAARSGMAQFAKLLAATVGLLLLIGCGTVGMLLLVRTEARREEFAMCLALGATRMRLARGIGIEGALLAVGGAVAALPVAVWLFAGARGFQLPGGVPLELLELSLSARTIALAIGGAIVATLFVTVLAGAFGFSANLADALRARSGATPRMERRRTRAALVATQVAVALVLLAGAGLFGRSVMAALNVNPGFDAQRLVSTTLSLQPFGYSPDRAASFFNELRSRLASNSAAASVSLSVSQGGMSSRGQLAVEGQARTFPSTVWYTAIDEHYLETYGLPVIRGRNFTATDAAGSPPVVLVSESFGRMLAFGGDPVGRRIGAGSAGVVEVVGVVPDVITNVSILEPLAMYFPIAQQPLRADCSVTIRAATDTDAVRRELSALIRQLDPAITPPPILTMEERLGRQMGAQQFGATVLGTLGVIAILLTVLGTYVLAESMAVLRMREMGIRAALGATRRQLAAIVLAETGRLVVIGIVTGLFVAWLSSGMIESFLFRVEPFDAVTLVTVCALILVLALLVSVRPALRAARVDLGTVLKEE